MSTESILEFQALYFSGGLISAIFFIYAADLGKRGLDGADVILAIMVVLFWPIVMSYVLGSVLWRRVKIKVLKSILKHDEQIPRFLKRLILFIDRKATKGRRVP